MNDKSTILIDSGRYIVLDYYYRDVSNYKSFGSIYFTGILTDIERMEVMECLDSGEFFVAEQVGVPPLYSALFGVGGGPTEDDHAWHTFEGFREVTELAEGADVRGEASSLLAVFRAAKRNWHPELSPNFYC